MARLRVNSFSISLDGFGAGPNQSLDNPLGVGGEALHEWARRDAHVPADVWQRRRHDRHRRRLRGARLRQHRRVDPRPQHVRPGPRPVARRQLERLVGRQSAVPRARLRADASPARADHDGGRHDVPFRHRRHPRGAGARHRGGRRPGRPARRRGATIRQYLRRGSSTRCTWRSRPCCSAPANSSSPAWTARRSATSAPSTWQRPGHPRRAQQVTCGGGFEGLHSIRVSFVRSVRLEPDPVGWFA